MPTYVYACTECGHQFEAHQSFSDASLTECPACSGKLRKVFNSVGIVFKGSGFYRNDSRDKPAGPSTAGSDKGSDKAPEKSGDKAAATSSSSDSAKTSDSSTSSGSSSGSSNGASSAGSSSSPSPATKAGTGSGSAA